MLMDQHGKPFQMASTKGKVVVMTFIYTHCTDLCPFLALKLKNAHDLLGEDADKAVFVAVSTDPQRDTQDAIFAYSRAAGLDDDWHYVTGSLSAVKEVWFNYGVGVEIENPEDTHHHDENESHHDQGASHGHDESSHTSSMAGRSPDVPTQGLSSGDVEKAWKLVDEFGGGYDVGHSAPFWIIDRRGRIRASMDADALPSEIVSNVRSLLGR
jgi:cytochrome oxidase Cu insertion factor (SCO1/SenC/PrrC family)